MEQVQIIEIAEAKNSYTESINKLLAQLTDAAIVFTDADLEEIVASPGSRIFLLQYEGATAGMLSLGSYKTPAGRKFWIEDVVVDGAFRGKGFGKILVEHAVGYAARQKGASLMLTSNPARVAANNLYRSLGFQQKHTNVYKMDF